MPLDRPGTLWEDVIVSGREVVCNVKRLESFPGPLDEIPPVSAGQVEVTCIHAYTEIRRGEGDRRSHSSQAVFKTNVCLHVRHV